MDIGNWSLDIGNWKLEPEELLSLKNLFITELIKQN
jgi:hypothetical protein